MCPPQTPPLPDLNLHTRSLQALLWSFLRTPQRAFGPPPSFRLSSKSLCPPPPPQLSSSGPQLLFRLVFPFFFFSSLGQALPFFTAPLTRTPFATVRGSYLSFTFSFCFMFLLHHNNLRRFQCVLPSPFSTGPSVLGVFLPFRYKWAFCSTRPACRYSCPYTKLVSCSTVPLFTPAWSRLYWKVIRSERFWCLPAFVPFPSPPFPPQFTCRVFGSLRTWSVPLRALVKSHKGFKTCYSPLLMTPNWAVLAKILFLAN